MPCFNHARFLQDSIRSVLKQTYQNLELIIIDDCSSDNSWEIIERFANHDSRIKPIKHGKNEGLSRSRNDGLKIAGGHFVAFCDSDDVWEPEKLEVQMELLHDNQTCGLAYSDTMIINERGLRVGQRFSERFPLPLAPSGWLFGKLVRRNFINIQSVLIRKECVQSVGFFDEQVELVQDWWYWIQLSRDYRFLYSPKLLARYRVHSRSTNLVQKRGYCINRFKVFKRILRKYTDLPQYVRADLVFQMGAELCDLGKSRAGRDLLWAAVGLSITDWRAFGCLCRSSRRLLMIPRQNVGSSSPKAVKVRETGPIITSENANK